MAERTPEKKQYHREYNRERTRLRRSEWFRENGPCVECGSWENLEVDHIDPLQKSFTISFTEGKDRLTTELAKCQVLCSRCHLAKTKEEGSFSRNTWNRVKNPKHRTGPMYTRIKCRCSECREWKRLYERKEIKFNGLAPEA